ncbi:MAG TPA: serine hydrolase domain-containing protein [Gammaproteobacteria bacterium]|nr:serine hydrolase domain-containing protein [Gammaproteobacteria bacterium]HEV2613584.1 serine hydrolase domain-containing protein [Gammaproteobacteria bacterium]
MLDKKLDKTGIEKLRLKVGVTGLDIHTLKSSELDEHLTLGAVPKQSKAASLSKPVFAYLIVKLAQERGFNLDAPLDNFYKHPRLEGYEHRELVTARKVLSHQSGIPAQDLFPDQSFRFQFKPGDEYAYSGTAYKYLQDVIEKHYGKSLEELAQEIVFGPLALGMKNSSFIDRDHKDPLHAAYTLKTTAEDYAIFMKAMLRNPNMHEVFKPAISLMTDSWAKQKVENKELQTQDLQAIDSGLGWLLEKTDNGIIAFHWGDAGVSKSFVAMNLTTGISCVYFADKAQNGLSLVDPVITSTVTDLNHGLNFVMGKYGYQRHSVENLAEKERFETWDNMKYEIPPTMRAAWLAYLVEKNLVKKDYEPWQNTLVITCDSDKAGLLVKLIEHEFEKVRGEDDSATIAEKDNKSILRINIKNPELYQKFIEKLNTEKWLPATNTPQETAQHKSPTLGKK